MLTVLLSGLPVSAKDIVKDAMNEVFDGNIAIQELTKETLRSRVRLSNRSVEVVLVILDGVSSDMCSDIEGGLYKSDKYYSYTNDTELVKYLNNKYGLSMEIQESIEEVVQDISNSFDDSESETERYYLEKLNLKEDTIRHLESRIKELEFLYGLVDDEVNTLVSKSELERLRDENISLNNDVLDLKSRIDSEISKYGELENTLNSLKESRNLLENRLKKAQENCDEVVLELNELKVKYSQQSGIIREKENKIVNLEKEKSHLSGVSDENLSLKNTVSQYKKEISSKDTELGNLRVDLQSKERDILRYIKELESLKGLESISEKLDSANNTIDSLKSELSSANSNNDFLNKEVKEKDRLINQLSESNDEYSSRIVELNSTISELQERIKSDNESLLQLNKEKIELKNKISNLEISSKSDGDCESLLLEIDTLKSKLNKLSSNIFTDIGSYALPNGVIQSRVYKGANTFNNIRFAYAGSSESRKGSYKCLYDEFKLSSDDTRYLIVDLVSETSVDYVFGIKDVVPGLDWFRKGGSVQQYLSSTSLKNTKVLALGLGYINDSYFLCIDWAKRLVELNNSGYKVVLFCGDISNLVGRVLHESFSSFGESIIYVSGNAVGSRSIITNLKGLSNAKDSIVAYYDFNSAVEKFYNMVSRTNECRILSTKKNIRK